LPAFFIMCITSIEDDVGADWAEIGDVAVRTCAVQTAVRRVAAIVATRAVRISILSLFELTRAFLAGRRPTIAENAKASLLRALQVRRSQSWVARVRSTTLSTLLTIHAERQRIVKALTGKHVG